MVAINKYALREREKTPKISEMNQDMWKNPDFVPNARKGKSLMESEKTLITETDADPYLDIASKRNRNKRKEELYDLPSTT